MIVHTSTTIDRLGRQTVRTITHLGGPRYSSENREIAPQGPPEGRIVGGSPSTFTLVDGVARWESNGTVLMKDVVRDHAIDRVPGFDPVAHDAAREIEVASFVAAYRRHQSVAPSAEERSEARAAFGPGRTVVDVISGRTFRT